MRVLFDQGTPGPIRDFLPEHTIRTTREEGWETLSNGDLLRAAEEAGFEVLLTSKDRHRGAQPQQMANGSADDEEDSGGDQYGNARRLCCY